MATVAIATLSMGMAVAISWIAIGIRGEGFDLDPSSPTRPTRLAIYGIQFILVGLIGYAVARWRLRGESLGVLALVMVAAWIGQGLVLTVIGEPIVANRSTRRMPGISGWWRPRGSSSRSRNPRRVADVARS